MNPYADQPSRRGNEGFRVGLIGAICTSLLHLVLPLMAGGAAWGELFAWLLQFLTYFFVANSAAKRQVYKRRDDFESYRGIAGAGMGAALITSLLTWVFILIRALFIDALGGVVIVEPVSLYCIVFFDVAAALAIGSWRGNKILKNYQA